MSTLSHSTDQFSLDDWLDYLDRLHPKKIDLSLERIRTVAERMSLLKPANTVITVAGTNGKGTTCCALETILLEQGYRVGVYSSPHLIHYDERVRIQNQRLIHAEHIAAFQEIECKRGSISLSYFEFATLSALWLFKKHQVDVAILEVGLGGRLDATNIIDSDVAVITSIALDHVAILGDTREKIGYEKAGIFRNGRPAVVGEPDCPASIKQYAAEIGAILHLNAPNSDADWRFDLDEAQTSWSFQSNQHHFSQLPIANIPLPNAATALACLMQSQLVVTEQSIRRGLQKVQLAGRFQQIATAPHIFLDVAHNPHAAQYLAKKLQLLPRTGRLIAVVGILADKDIQHILSPLLELVDQWYLGTLQGERGATARQVANYLPENVAPYCFEQVSTAFQQALQQAEPTDVIIVFGSFHTVGAILEECTCNIEGTIHVIKT